jgi:hypothetical protein
MIIFLYRVWQYKNHVSMYRGTGWVLSPLSRITVLCEPSLVCTWLENNMWLSGLCVLGSGQCASARRAGRFNLRSDSRKGKKCSLYSKEHVSVKTDYNPVSCYLRIHWIFNKLLLLALLFKVCPYERSKNLDASSRYTYTVLNATTHRMEKGTLNLSTWCQLELSYITWRNWTWQQTRHNTSISWYPAKRGNGDGSQNRFLTPRHPPLCSNMEWSKV